MFETHFASGKSDAAADKAGALREMRILLAAPRGFCAGVRRAIDAVRDALAEHGRPVYVRRPIVHNLDVVRSLEAEGAIFVEELDEVPPGSVVLLSAHGVSPDVARDGLDRGLKVYDAVCPLVAKVHREVRRHARDGRSLVIVGHSGHPEIEGTLGHAGHAPTFVVGSLADVAALPIDRSAPTAFAVQTTFSLDDAAAIVTALAERFDDLVGPPSSDICYATTNRQRALGAIAPAADAILVVGETFSSNANRLMEIASAHCAAQLVAGPSAIDWAALADAGTIAITSAASTPEAAVEAVLEALAERFTLRIEESRTEPETAIFKRLSVA